MRAALRFIGLFLVPPVVALGLAFLLGALLIWLVPWLSSFGAQPIPRTDPLAAYRVMFEGTLGTTQGLSMVLFHATPLILCGLAVALAFQAGLFNIGGQGQMVVGGMASALTGIYLGQLVGSAWLLLPVCALAAALAGGLWGAIPGGLKAWRGAHEVVTTIMMNLIAAGLTMYLVVHRFSDADSGATQTLPVVEGARIPRIHDALGLLDPHTPVNLMLPVAVILALLVWGALRTTRWGYEVRTVGLNPSAAEYGGISSGWTSCIVMGVCGGLAGLASLSLVNGYQHYFASDVFAAQHGFWGIAVALLARNHPLGVIPSALLFGFLFQGSTEIGFETRLPKDVITILQGLVIVCVVVTGELIRRWLD